MDDTLNAPPPSWLTLAPPLKTTPAAQPEEPAKPTHMGIRPKGRQDNIEIGGQTYRFGFPSRELMWLAVSPSGKRVVITRGDHAEIREVTEDRTLSHDSIPLPELNYDSANRWRLKTFCRRSRSACTQRAADRVFYG
jgi:hypothetical protein